jgi:hypothetical protein
MTMLSALYYPHTDVRTPTMVKMITPPTTTKVPPSHTARLGGWA